jgi:hypothetical protein
MFFHQVGEFSLKSRLSSQNFSKVERFEMRGSCHVQSELYGPMVGAKNW